MIHVCGGVDNDHNYLNKIETWDPVSETWQKVGNLQIGRDLHAAVAVPAINVASYCAAK